MSSKSSDEPSDIDLLPWPENEKGERLALPCGNCGTTSIALVFAPQGCVAFPNDQFLLVCPQHMSGYGFIDENITLVAELFPGAASWAGY